MERNLSLAAGAASDDEDDYMNMTFTEQPAPKETSLQRVRREKKEAAARGLIKSKAQREAEEAEAREKALSTSLLDAAASKKSKGLRMMAKMGFTGGALGSKENAAAARVEPIKVSIKEDRGGIGLESEKRRKFDEAAEREGKKPRPAPLDPDEYRDRVRRERELARLERQVHAAMRLAEQMGEEKAAPLAPKDTEDKLPSKERTIPSRPLKSIPVLWRGLVRHREEAERDRRMRHDLEQGLSRLPTYEDPDEDDDDRRAFGRSGGTVYVTAEDLDEEDAELDAFNALEVGERLRRLVAYLREEHLYCFWCKFTYPDKEMEGCPGSTEEEHD